MGSVDEGDQKSPQLGQRRKRWTSVVDDEVFTGLCTGRKLLELLLLRLEYPPNISKTQKLRNDASSGRAAGNDLQTQGLGPAATGTAAQDCQEQKGPGIRGANFLPVLRHGRGRRISSLRFQA